MSISVTRCEHGVDDL